MNAMSKFEMVMRAYASVANDQNRNLILFTNMGVIECKLNNIVSQKDIDENKPLLPLQVALSTELEEEEFASLKNSQEKSPFLLLKDVTIIYPGGKTFTSEEMTIFLDSVEGVSTGHAEIS